MSIDLRCPHLQPDQIGELVGSDLYFGSFNDGFDFAYAGHRVDTPFWWAFHQAKAAGFAYPRAYAHGFCDGYRCHLDQEAHPERWENYEVTGA